MRCQSVRAIPEARLSGAGVASVLVAAAVHETASYTYPYSGCLNLVVAELDDYVDAIDRNVIFALDHFTDGVASVLTLGRDLAIAQLDRHLARRVVEQRRVGRNVEALEQVVDSRQLDSTLRVFDRDRRWVHTL